MTQVKKQSEELDLVTIRFAGDSGDGMQLTGNQFTENSAIFGNDISTFPDFPAEIRAPAGSLAGVSSFQLQFSSKDIHTPGDILDVLVAMNPAALKVHLQDLKENGMLLVNTANYTPKNLKLAGYEQNPLEDGSLKAYRLIQVDMNKLVITIAKGIDLKPKIVTRSTNMFALGILFWLYEREPDSTIKFLNEKFAKKPEIVEVNTRALKAGINYGETVEIIRTTFRVPKATLKKGLYRNIMGNQATAYGVLAAAQKSGLEVFYGGYPITPASDVLHYLSAYKHFGVKTFQAEDEIAGIMSTIGASFAGDLAITATSGPGVALKTEAIGLATITELPLVIINVQRGGPSTGLPTKTEQSDLLQAMFSRNGDAPNPIIAPYSPGDCYYAAFEACRIALKYMMPVFLLTDGYLANGSEPWLIPSLSDMPEIPTRKVTNPNGFQPYTHDKDTLARDWAVPGTEGMEHRVGGLEKSDGDGNVCYDPMNHDQMTRLRHDKVEVIANDIESAVPFGEESGQLLILGWGSTYGAIRSAVELAIEEGLSVSHLHLRHINPFPANLGDVLLKFQKVIIPELNMGQLSMLIRSKYLVDAIAFNKIQGKPFTLHEIYNKIKELVEG
ncbi:MAG: 2-oxoacid:acceptor oxidoreductase subunit alpha [Candidatus Marinimicrobia bacterium]|nr:2-oxoacid:acceptor oxidoreductase subunit alpha [Candidatus Neomarinimicrobiota bacterium]